MIYPPASDCRNGKQHRDDQDILAICDSYDGGKKYQGKQKRYNQISTFDFLDKRGTGEEESESN